MKPQTVYQYKIQPASSQTPLTRSRLASCLQYALLFQTVTSLVGNILLWRFRYQWINIVSPVQDLPSLSGYWWGQADYQSPASGFPSKLLI